MYKWLNKWGVILTTYKSWDDPTPALSPTALRSWMDWAPWRKPPSPPGARDAPLEMGPIFFGEEQSWCKVVVWVNFGGILPGILKCMYGWILEGFSLIISCIVCLGWCRLMFFFFFSRWCFFSWSIVEVVEKMAWYLEGKYYWRIQPFFSEPVYPFIGQFMNWYHHINHQSFHSYASNFRTYLSNSSSLFSVSQNFHQSSFNSDFRIIVITPTKSKLKPSRISNFPRTHGTAMRLKGCFWWLPWGLNQQPFWISNYTLINKHTVDGSNPAPVEVGCLSHYFQGIFTSQLVQDFFHQQ